MRPWQILIVFGYFWFENVPELFQNDISSIATFVSFLKLYSIWIYLKKCWFYKQFYNSSCNEVWKLLPILQKNIIAAIHKKLNKIYIFHSKFIYYTILES